MRTNLAVIHDTFKEVVEAPVAVPKSVIEAADQASRITIAGLPVVSEAVRENRIRAWRDARNAAIGRYGTDAAHLNRVLDTYKVKPLAVLPTMAWYRLCVASGLFFIKPDENGAVHIDMGQMLNFISAKRYRWSSPSRKEAIQEYLDSQTWAATLKDFSRGQNAFLSAPYVTSDRQIKFDMPTPPADICELLQKIAPLNPATVAESGAFSLGADPVQALLDAKESKTFGYRGYASYAEWLEKCPIVYVRNMTAVAVMAQFGDFPIEKEVVEKVSSNITFTLRGLYDTDNLNQNVTARI